MPETLARAATIEASDVKQWYQSQRRFCDIYNADGERVPLHHEGKGRSAFLLCSGPSLSTIDLSLLNQRGIVTMGLNNSPAAVAAQLSRMPDYWTCVDTPIHFIEQIWKDPTVRKFAPFGHIGRKIKTRNERGELVDSAFRVEECPNVYFYNRANRFNVQAFLLERDFNWGNSDSVTDELGIKGSRSVMLVALKLLYYMGFSPVYLLGADFKMEVGQQNYAFAQDRTEQSVRGNNKTYQALNMRFDALQPHFKAAGFQVYNCTKDSGLGSFPYKEYTESVADAARECNEKPINTLKMYEQK